jgi:murein L,D-transpeptidase YcbB/YkuD
MMLGAVVFAGGAIGPNAPQAEAVITAACTTKSTRTVYSAYDKKNLTYYIPTVSGSATNCYNYSDNGNNIAAVAVINNALRKGHEAYQVRPAFQAIDAASTNYSSTTIAAVKVVQSWNSLSQDGKLGPATKNITYWPTTTARRSVIHATDNSLATVYVVPPLGIVT